MNRVSKVSKAFTINSSTYSSTCAVGIEYRTCDQEVVRSILGRARGIKTLGKFSHLCASVIKQYKLVLA